MILATVVVCDAPEKRAEIEALLSTESTVVHLASVSRQTIVKQELAEGIKIIWIELAPDPQKGLSLLTELKEHYPRAHFLVSYETLESDLVKTAMQLGAIEYLDKNGAAMLFPPAIARIVAKEESPQPQHEAAAVREAIPHPELTDMLHRGPHDPRPSTNPIRRKSTTPDLDPNNPLNALPIWVLPTVMLILIIAIGILLTIKH